jgi:aspartyl protease family protein
MGSWLALGLLIAAGVALFLNHEDGTVAGMATGEFASMTALLAILIFLSGGLIGGYRGRIGRAIRDGVSWALLAFILVAGYSYKDQILPVVQRVVGEIVPGTPITMQTETTEEHAVRIRKQLGGHFVARADVNGTAVNMIVDTGASTVVLTPDDARELGFDTDKLPYTVPVQTANGRSFAAQVRLPDVAVGPVRVADVQALIARPGALHHSLLGMSFLSRLRSYEFSGDFLTLRG